MRQCAPLLVISSCDHAIMRIPLRCSLLSSWQLGPQSTRLGRGRNGVVAGRQWLPGRPGPRVPSEFRTLWHAPTNRTTTGRPGGMLLFIVPAPLRLPLMSSSSEVYMPYRRVSPAGHGLVASRPVRGHARWHRAEPHSARAARLLNLPSTPIGDNCDSDRCAGNRRSRPDVMTSCVQRS